MADVGVGRCSLDGTALASSSAMHRTMLPPPPSEGVTLKLGETVESTSAGWRAVVETGVETVRPTKREEKRS